MKIAAGPVNRRLKGRNPTHAAVSASARTSTRSFGWTRASIAKYAAAMPARLAARPSMLSRKLNAFVMPTSQTSASGIAIQSEWTISTVRPPQIATPAAATCAASFGKGPSERTSSTSPVTKSTAAPPRMPRSVESASTAPSATAAPAPARMPAKIAMPPSVGVSRSCQRSRAGSATIRFWSGERSVAQTRNAVTGAATKATAALTPER